MGEQQWCLRVDRNGAEEIRRMLLADGVLDRTLKIRPDGDMLLFPILSEREGATRADFEPLRQRAELPRHELVGGIAIMQDDDPGGAAIILKERPSVHTVLYAESPVQGTFRTKQFRVLAGEETTTTTHTEYGRTFRVDLEKAYFSARLASERQRIVRMMENREEVLDMFAGVGPFAIMLAEKASVVWACDLNPDAVSLLILNTYKNRVSNVVPVLADAGILPHIFGKRFDRIIMNLPLMGEKFLPAAFSLCRSGGMIHFYSLVSDDEDGGTSFSDIPVLSVERRFVRSYAPGRSHIVFDITVR
jgi:tRNA (guanine37-N1)-methyltransferase